jgi:hypothetical protein
LSGRLIVSVDRQPALDIEAVTSTGPAFTNDA